MLRETAVVVCSVDFVLAHALSLGQADQRKEPGHSQPRYTAARVTATQRDPGLHGESLVQNTRITALCSVELAGIRDPSKTRRRKEEERPIREACSSARSGPLQG